MTVNIAAAGTYDSVGTITAKPIPFLKYSGYKQGLSFEGTLPATSLKVGFLENVDGTPTFRGLSGGTITALPSTFVVETIPPQGLAIEVVGASADFNIDDAGKGEKIG